MTKQPGNFILESTKVVKHFGGRACCRPLPSCARSMVFRLRLNMARHLPSSANQVAGNQRLAGFFFV